MKCGLFLNRNRTPIPGSTMHEHAKLLLAEESDHLRK